MPRVRTVVLVVATVLALALVAAVAWFEPYKLLINKTVDESRAPVREGKAGWHVFAASRRATLAGSRAIWCDRFHVSFGAASVT